MPTWNEVLQHEQAHYIYIVEISNILLTKIKVNERLQNQTQIQLWSFNKSNSAYMREKIMNIKKTCIY